MSIIRELTISRKHLFRAAEAVATLDQEDLIIALTQTVVEINKCVSIISKTQTEESKNLPVPILQDDLGRTLVITDEA
jgi:hypothetical protein